MSDNGHPRFPVFLRERGDMDWAAVLANAKTKAPFSSLKKKAVPLLQKQHSILFSTIPSRDQESGKKIVTANDADDDQDEAAAAGLLLTKGSSTHSSKKGAGGAAAAGGKGKQICKWHPNCYQRNSAHLLAFDHPAAITGGEADEDDIPEGDAAEPRNGDMPDDPADEDYSEKESKKKKRAKTAAVASPSAAAPTAAASASPASPTKGSSPKVCWYGTACYNHDPDHIKRFSHPPKPAAPTTKEEYIAVSHKHFWRRCDNAADDATTVSRPALSALSLPYSRPPTNRSTIWRSTSQQTSKPPCTVLRASCEGAQRCCSRFPPRFCVVSANSVATRTMTLSLRCWLPTRMSVVCRSRNSTRTTRMEGRWSM